MAKIEKTSNEGLIQILGERYAEELYNDGCDSVRRSITVYAGDKKYTARMVVEEEGFHG